MSLNIPLERLRGRLRGLEPQETNHLEFWNRGFVLSVIAMLVVLASVASVAISRAH